jgi:hypothetical protein
MSHKTVTVDELLQEVKNALEYGKALGYSECLSQTIGNKPETSNPAAAIKHYLETLEEDYTQK